MNRLYPVSIRVGPLPVSGRPGIEMVFPDGSNALVDLEIGQAHQFIDRFRECLDGRICQRVPSRRVLEIPVGFPDEEPSSLRNVCAAVPDLEADRFRQGPL